MVSSLMFDLHFYRHWIWWLLLALLLIHTFFQLIGFHSSRLSGLPRETFGKIYAYALWLRLVIWTIMLFTTSLLSVLVSIVVGVLWIYLSYPTSRLFSYVVIMDYTGRDFAELENHLEFYFARLLEHKIPPEGV